jgi:hypothetical protein
MACTSGTRGEHPGRIAERDWEDGRDEVGIPSVHVAPFSPVSRFTLQKLWRLSAHSPHYEMSLLFPQRNLDHQTPHDVIHLKVFLRAARMGIVTA